tara:strand:+ start:367 stop:543 length:177 start_codon:yes stop_codon:yes gene_type:complete
MEEIMLNTTFREGYQKGYSDAVKEVVERLKAKDDIYKKDLEGVNYDLQTDYQPTNVTA